MSENKCILRSFEQNIIEKLNDSYTKNVNVNDIKGVSIFHEPFTHCVISDLVTDKKFITDLEKEIKSKLKYKQKNNDLYKFNQTPDLAKNKLPNLSKFRDVLYNDFSKLLKEITNVELSATKIDVTSSKYEYTDYLLCHDDDIHGIDNKGRRFAFIYYLVPDDWDKKDGGNLDLFTCDENLQPVKIEKSIIPKANSLLFFEVSDRSFHQVSEVFAKNKTRLSINGWFHGEINHRPERFIETIPEPSPYINIDANLFFDWIVEKYLKPTNQTEIQLKFSDSSEIKLDKIFHPKKFEEVSDALGSSEITWIKKGPAHRRNYEVADSSTLPQIVKDLVSVLTCDFMGLTLSNMTGLALHSSVVKSKNAASELEFDDDEEGVDEDNESFESDEDGDDGSSDGADDDNDDDDNEDYQIESQDQDLNENFNKRKLKDDSSEEAESSKPCTSKSLEESENLYKKLKKTDDSDKPCSSKSDQEIQQMSSNGSDYKREELFEIKSEAPKCYCEVRRWKQGAYTLVTDDDNEIKTQALDLMIFFKCKLWSMECGGNVSYIARDEDNELLTVNPEENCISLVYRDEETLKFTKYVNSNVNNINQDGCFYEISLVYYE